MQAGLMQRLAKRFGFDQGSTPADPQVTALVQAAARGDTDEVDRLLADGVAINAEAPAPLPGGKSIPGWSQLFAGGTPQIPMTPLLAAVVHKQRPTAERLLAAGADSHLGQSHFGTPVHVATAAGDAEMLQVLIEHGADVNAPSAHGQTPLQMLAASRPALDRLAQMQATLKAMGMKLPAQFSNIPLPTEGWDACERLLKAHGAQ
jgi:ankyrin repeat protein